MAPGVTSSDCIIKRNDNFDNKKVKTFLQSVFSFPFWVRLYKKLIPEFVTFI